MMQTPYSVLISHDFMPGEQRIAPATYSPPNPPNNVTYYLTLTAKLARISGSPSTNPKYLQLFYSDTGDKPYNQQSTDGSLDLRVPPLGCRYHITLDSNIDWQFRHDPNATDPGDYSNDAMTLGADYSAYYPRLAHIGTQEIWFDALYDSTPDANNNANVHHFNLYVSLTLINGADPIILKIDPDILNPGDHNRPLMIGRRPRGEKAPKK